MTDEDETSPIFNNNNRPTGDDGPLFTCALKLDRHDYEEKTHLERTIRQLIEALRLKRASLPPEVQSELHSKLAPLEYFDDYCLDRCGDELASLNVGALQLGWSVPEYEQVYRIALPDSEQQASLHRARRPKPSCFNCGALDHGVQGCSHKLDSERIRRSRDQFQEQMAEACGYNEASQTNGYGTGSEPTSRYHEDAYQSSLNEQIVIEERFRRYQPGLIGYELRQALGLHDNQLPIYIYNMRRCGYPPGWLREARVKKSGLQVFHDKEEGEIIEAKKAEPIDPTGQDNVFPAPLPDDSTLQTQADINGDESFEYDFDKVVSYPGFNIQVPDGYIDEAYTSPNLPQFDSQQSKENLIQEMYLLKKPSLKRKSTLETYKPTPIDELTTPKHSKIPPTGTDSPPPIMSSQSQSNNSEQRSLGQVYGTPLWSFSSGTANPHVHQQLPSRNQFQQGICDHLPFENLPSYQTEKVGRIFDLLKDVQKRLESLNNDPPSSSTVVIKKENTATLINSEDMVQSPETTTPTES